MSYVVLARKYRPRSFEDMVGQDHVVRALTHALEQQRLHHAYLFTGTRGIGKTTVSRILAKSLNCQGADGQGGITARPCGVCSACREIDADRYIDYIELDAASNRSIDEIRELIERAAYKPSVGRFKVFMIDEAHQLTKDAFNALLKTLEEPPEYLKFVLATTDPEKMLPTVLSRCLQFNLRPMAPPTVAEYLERVLAAEAIPAEPGALRLLSRAARGSMRDALSLTDQAIAYGGGRLEEAGVRAMLGSVDRRHAQRLVAALAGRDGRAVLDECEGLRRQGLSASATLEEMARLLQQMAVEQAVPGALDASDPDTEPARRLAPALAADETQLLYSICLQGRAELGLAPDEHAGLVMVLLRFLAFPPATAGGAGGASGGSAGSGEHSTGATGPGAVAMSATPAAVAPAAMPVPAPAPVAARPVAAPPPAPVAVPAPAPVVAAPVSAAARLAQEAAEKARARAASRPPEPQDEDGPPPWMDEAPPVDALEPGETIIPASAEVASEPIELSVPAASAPAVSLRRTPLGDAWAEAVTALQQAGLVSALARELAMQAELVATDGERWTLRVERDSLRNAPLLDKLQAALRQLPGHAGRSLATEPGVAQDSPALRDAEAARQRQAEAEAAFRADPLVVAALQQFAGARIVPGTVRPH
ncbi:DNA polymerase III subunit gamma/tau [Ideonella sp. 4Y16]|uniref:DNA polymerase III subunit gamma/tau n=1 Tax=Ideonella alba TaxID=2824118 RepID=UPI001B380DDB|nr:DNA polymerase III subunit gamma/tau [Ideonella alba]MBQ0945108.1 DNA polymerase III subunit gamma/tau [Ideonella alba]